jgi:hypothetical protein
MLRIERYKARSLRAALECNRALGLTKGATTHNHNKKGTLMSNTTEESNRDSVVDARAIFFLIVIVVSTAVFWVSQQ